MAFTISRAKIAPVLCKVESTYGTDSTPTGASDALWTVDATTVEPNIVPIDFDTNSSSFTRPPGQMGAAEMGLGFSFMLEGSSAPGTTHPIGDVLQCCGITETASGTVSVTYTPAAISVLKSATAWAELHGVIHKVTGMYGNVSMSGNPRDGIRCTFNGRGLFQEATQGTIASFTPGTLRAKAFLNVTTTLTPSGGSAYTPVFQSFTFNRGASIQQVEDAVDSTGLDSLLFEDADPSLEMVIALDTDSGANLRYAGTAAQSMFRHLREVTTHAVAFSFGSVAGNQIAFSFPQAQLRSIRPGRRNGYNIVTLQYAVRHSTANSEFSITIT